MSHSLRPAFTYRDLLVTYLKPQWLRVLLMTLLLFAGIALQLVNPQILRYFIDSATIGVATQALILAGTAFVGIALCQQAITVVGTYVSQNVAWTATNQLRTDLVAHCLTLDMAFHKTRSSGEFIERIDGDVDALSTFFSQAIVQLLGNALLIVGIVALLFHEDWRIGLAMTLFVLLGFFVLLRIRNFATPFWIAARQQDAEFFGFLSEQLVGTEDIRANGATSYVLRRFHQLLRNWLPISRKANLASYTLVSTTILLFAIGNALALAVGASLYGSHVISLGTVYLIFFYINLLNGPMEQIRTQLQQLQQASAGIERIRKLFQEAPSIGDGLEASLPAGPLALDFTDVSFGYETDATILHKLNFHLQPGSVLGVLGRTGSGKTTLARLILRLYAIQVGEIQLGGVPINHVRLRDLRQHIGLVTQDVQLFHATVRDNLTFFNRAIGDERILAALADIGLLPWYKSLELGLDTELGSDGEGLSAGEAQLLAFTRVFLADPGLVILDEASSRLDPATEQLIEHAISKLLAGRTGIVIAHRLGTLQRADEIMLMAHGRILEHGRRATLANDPHSHFYHLLQSGLEEIHA